MAENKAPRLGKSRDWLYTLGASLLCVVIGLLIGFIVLVILAAISAAQSGGGSFSDVLSTAFNSGFKQILMGGFYMRPIGIGRELATAAPLVMTGLSVGFAFKTGLFNIGAAGQYTLGAFGGICAAIMLHLPWWACLLVSAAFGAVWGAIPGIFKALLNINEVISSIMFNWIGLYAVNTIMYNGGKSPLYDAAQTKTYVLRDVSPASVIPGGASGFMGSLFKNRSTTIAIFIAIIFAILVWVIISRTTLGYELKACGHNKNAAKYAGINEKRNIILSMTIAGALAGLGGGLYYLSGVGEWSPMNSTALPSQGFDGIAVALLASSNPIGTVFSALLISHIRTGGNFMYSNVFPPEVSSVISGIIIYLCAFSMLFRGSLQKLFTKKSAVSVTAADPPEADEAEPAPDEPGGKEAED